MTQWWHGLCAGEAMAAKTTMALEDCTLNITSPLWGAIYCRSPFDVTLRRCTFNALGGIQTLFQAGAVPSDPGSGNETPDSSLVMEDCTFYGGSASSVAVGGVNTTVKIDRCWFSRPDNLPSNYAFELYNTGETTVANTVVEGTNCGMGIKSWNSPTAPKGSTRIAHCTVIGTVDSAHSIGVELVNNPPTVLKNSIILGWNIPVQGATEGANNITDAAQTDPLFVAPNPFAPPATIGEGDYHLTSTSPAIDAGTCDDGPLPDFDGNPRPNGESCDIGAYEFTQSVTPEICSNQKDDDLDGDTDCDDSDCATVPSCQVGRFHRGDPNNDGVINITDGIYILNFLFLGGPKPTCTEAANPNDDATVNITDGIYVLNFLFLGGPPPAAPGPTALPCGQDPVDSPTNLGCDSYTKC